MGTAKQIARKPARIGTRRRTAAERRETRRILFGGKVGRPSKYRPDHHPQDLVAYFRPALDALRGPRRIVLRNGRVKYVQRPIRLPTLAAYAVRIGVRRETLWAWTRRHEAFAEAVGICKAIQEHLLSNMGLLRAYRPGFTILLLRNLRRGTDPGAPLPGPAFALQLDPQDLEAIGEPFPDAGKGLCLATERREGPWILIGRRVGGPSPYRRDFHPDDLVAYFEAPADAIEEIEEVVSRRSGLRYVQRPAPFPTFAGYAAKIGVSQETLGAWARQDEAFAEAVGICQAIQEELLVTMGALRAYAASVAIFLLKSLLGWRNEGQPVAERPFVLRVDAPDAAV